MSGYVAALMGRELGVSALPGTAAPAGVVAPRLASRYELQGGPAQEPPAQDGADRNGRFGVKAGEGSDGGAGQLAAGWTRRRSTEDHVHIATQSRPTGLARRAATAGIPETPDWNESAHASAISPRAGVTGSPAGLATAAPGRAGVNWRGVTPLAASVRGNPEPAQVSPAPASAGHGPAEAGHPGRPAGVVPRQAEVPAPEAPAPRRPAPVTDARPAAPVAPRLDPLPRPAPGQQGAPSVHVSIGRIEVRAATAPAPVRQAAGRAAPMSLEEYLGGRP